MKKIDSNHLNRKYIKYQEESRTFCRNMLRGKNKEETAKNRKKAAKAIGYELTTLNAALDQREKGGQEFWFKLRYYIASIDGDGEVDDVAFFDKINSLSQLTLSERKFQALSNIPIVNEEIKFKLSSSLEQMLVDLNSGLQKNQRKN